MPNARLKLAREPAGESTEVQTARTIAKMNSSAEAAAYTPAVDHAYTDAIRGLPTNATDEDKARRIFWWVKRHVQFRDDPAQDELLIAPDLLLSMPQPMGDCDDFSTLTAAMLERAGIPWEFVTVAADEAEPHRLSHVYVEAKVNAPRAGQAGLHGLGATPPTPPASPIDTLGTAVRWLGYALIAVAIASALARMRR